MSNCTDVIVHYRFYMFFFFFFFFFFALDVIVQCMVLGCNRTFIGNDVILPNYVALMLLIRLISKLKKIKLDTRMEDTTYRRMYPTGAVIPKFYGLPKVHKENTPLRPIVSSIGSVSYGVAKEIARIIKPLVGSTEHHVNNSKEFIEEMKKMKLEEGECITSYDVSALFTSIPIPSALDIINNKLQEDTDLHNKTNMTTHNIIELLDFCLNNTYFIFQGCSTNKPRVQPWVHLWAQ